MQFFYFKLWVVQTSGLSRDALHVYVSLGLFLLVRLLWRGRYSSVIALIVIAVAAVTGELLDHHSELVDAMRCRPWEHWRDILNTMFWPTVLALTLPWLSRREKSAAEEDEASGEDAERRLEQA
jgi:hypothetical protein